MCIYSIQLRFCHAVDLHNSGFVDNNIVPTLFQSDATMRDVILAIRADEAQHRLVNHTFASMKKYQWNPYRPGE